jgi:hypothetical protein
MDTCPHPEQPDLSLQLPRSMYYQLIHTLRAALPPVSDAPEDLARRDHAAIAQVASMLPANAGEANLAAQSVAASARAIDCMRMANEYRTTDHSFTLKFDARAATMMREARGARALLLRLQAVREKREADPAAADRAAWTEHCAIGLMAQALGGLEPAPVAEPPPPAPEPASEEEPQLDPVAEADQYATIYPLRAALIRATGGLPDKLDFGPPSPDLVQAIVTGTSPALRALDPETAAAD